MTEAELRYATSEMCEGIKKLLAASQTHPVDTMREACRKRLGIAEEELANLVRELKN